MNGVENHQVNSRLFFGKQSDETHPRKREVMKRMSFDDMDFSTHRFVCEANQLGVALISVNVSPISMSHSDSLASSFIALEYNMSSSLINSHIDQPLAKSPEGIP